MPIEINRNKSGVIYTKKYFILLFLLITLFMFHSSSLAQSDRETGIGVYLYNLQDKPYIIAILSKGQNPLKLTDSLSIENLPIATYNTDGYTVCGIYGGKYSNEKTKAINGYQYITGLPMRYEFKLAVQYISGELIVSDVTVLNKTRKDYELRYADVVFDVKEKTVRVHDSLLGYDLYIGNNKNNNLLFYWVVFNLTGFGLLTLSIIIIVIIRRAIKKKKEVKYE